jgi:FkbM family methyltransferase
MKAVGAVSNLARFFSTHPLTRDAPFEAWARFVSSQVRSRIQDEVTVSWIGGQRLAVRRGMTGATGNIYVGLHEFADMMLPLHLLREGDLFLDIGSNVGTYTILASGVRRATTWAFEPDPETMAALKRNIDLNDLNGRVVVHELALGDTDGTVSFTRGLDTVNRVATGGEASVRTVPIKRLDTLTGNNRPLMIKMDVEGYEEPVVRGALGLLAGDSPQGSKGSKPHLTTTASDVRIYDPFRRALTATPNDQPSSNAVFVRDWEFVAARLAAAPAVEVLGRSI